MRIDVGGGTIPRDGHTNLDPVHGEGEWRRRAQETPWPTLDRSVTSIVASHVLEHVAAGWERIAVMNEAHRVLEPGGLFEIVLPLVGYTDRETGAPMSDHIGWQPWADPTHVSLWWFPESLLYFCDGPFKANADYGISLWRLESWDVRDGWEGHAVLVKP